MIRRAFERIPNQVRWGILLGAVMGLLVLLQGCSSAPVTAVRSVCLPMRDYTGTTVVQDAASEVADAEASGVPMDNQKTLNRDYHVLRNLNKLACNAEHMKGN